jgi:hypothetical protein
LRPSSKACAKLEFPSNDRRAPRQKAAFSPTATSNIAKLPPVGPSDQPSVTPRPSRKRPELTPDLRLNAEQGVTMQTVDK